MTARKNPSFLNTFIRTIKELDSLIPRIYQSIATLERNNLYLLNQILEVPREEFEGKGVLIAEKSIAFDSLDSIYPKGAISDITHSPSFVAVARRHFGDKLRFLDLGCAGGGLVFDFLRDGHDAYGLEGSDSPRNADFGFWPLLGNKRLFTCDITEPWHFLDKSQSTPDRELNFDLISAWEVLEHIPEAKVPKLLSNIKRNLSVNGFFIGSVATFPSIEKLSGIDLHVNKNPRIWWEERFKEHGLHVLSEEDTYTLFPSWSLVRGAGNKTAVDWMFTPFSDLGFHIAVRNKS